MAESYSIYDSIKIRFCENKTKLIANSKANMQNHFNHTQKNLAESTIKSSKFFAESCYLPKPCHRNSSKTI